MIEFTLYPLLMKCTRCINFSIRARFLLGMFVFILYELHLLGIELVVTQTSDLHNSTCFYYVNSETVSLYWLIPPNIYNTYKQLGIYSFPSSLFYERIAIWHRHLTLWIISSTIYTLLSTSTDIQEVLYQVKWSNL